MKRIHGVLIAALALATLLPAALAAQEMRTYTVRARGMLGISYDPVGMINPRQHVVREVVKDSPAERAGILPGDTIIRVNGLTASAQIMGAPFEPGDTVVLRVKRDGREREFTIVAAERPGAVSSTFSYVLPDTVMGRISIIMDAMRAHVDTAHMPAIRLRSGDSTWMFRGRADSLFMRRFGADSAGVFHFRNGDSTRIFHFGTDSTHSFFHRDSIGIYSLDADFRGLLELDSLRTRVLRYVEGMPAIIADSMFMMREGGRVFHYGSGDSLVFARPAEIFAGGMTIGRRAVAGAELSELNAGLAEYFGATEGVLVLNARDGTPAARAGLRAGDVILRADDTAITSIMDLRRAIDRARAGTSVRLEVQRRGERVSVTLDRE